MVNFQSLSLPVIVIKGNLIGDKLRFESYFDPSSSHTEGQIRALQMKLSRVYSLDHFQFELVYEIDGSDSVYFVMKHTPDGRKVYAILLKHGKFSEDLKSAVLKVLTQNGEFNATDFYNHVDDIQKSTLTSSDEELTYGQAVQYLGTIIPDGANHQLIKRMYQILVFEKLQPQFPLFDNLKVFLHHLTEDVDNEYILNESFLLAKQFEDANVWDKALELYIDISNLAKTYDQLPLMISSKLRAVEISKELGKDPFGILELLNEIDDGSMEVATQDEREQYYSMLGHFYDKVGEYDMAEDLHSMAIMISESETSPSIYIAQSHAYLGKISGINFQPEIATRQYLTASTIAHSKEDRHLGTLYSHKAALYELQWSKFLSSTAIVMNMNSDRQNAEFYAWQSLKRLVNCISHSDRSKRKTDLLPGLQEIIEMNKVILPENSEYAHTTLNELEKQLSFFADGVLPVDQENELLKFIATKISAMLPLPPPMVMIIANDGRLVLGGEVGAETWDESIMTNDDLFSGALSAIMAILSEVITGTEPLRMLDAGQTQIMIEKSDVCIGALLVDRDLNVLRKALRQAVTLMEHEYPGLSDWDGYSIDFSSAKPRIENIFTHAMENITN